MTPEEIIIDNVENSTSWVLSYDMIYEVIIPCMEKYGKQQWNEAIKLAAENAKLLINGKPLCAPRFIIENYDTFYSETEIEVDKQEILKLLK